MKILVVDDSPVARRMIRWELERGGYAVQEASGEEDALAHFAHLRPQMVTLDLGQDGSARFALLEKIRTLESSWGMSPDRVDTPVVFITGQQSEALRGKVMMKGAAAVISKPFAPGKLLEEVEGILEPLGLWRGITVLLVDDSNISRRVMAETLRKLGVQLFEARDGDEALILAQEHATKLDMVILDQYMPVLNGDRTCRRMREIPELKNIPITIISAEDNRNAISGFYEAGATDYFSKPFLLDEFVARTGAHLRVAALTRSLAAWKSQMEEHLHLAVEVQQAAVRKMPALAHAQVGIVYQPQQGVSGDVYDCSVTAQGDLSAFLGDATGHGVDAALMTTMVLATLASSETEASPAKSLEHLHTVLKGRFRDRFVTACSLCLSPTGRLTVASAGHPPPLLLRANGKVELLESDGGPPLGMFPAPLNAKEHSVSLEKGERVLLYSDGLTEHPTPGGGQFGQERLMGAFLRSAALPVEDAIEVMIREVCSAAGGEVSTDDVTALLISYC
mgnify:CR=1 FL=1